MATLPDERIQFTAQRGQVGQLPLYVDEMLAGYGVHGFTRPLFLVGKIEQCPNLLNGKSEVARATDEGKAADVHGGMAVVCAELTSSETRLPFAQGRADLLEELFPALQNSASSNVSCSSRVSPLTPKTSSKLLLSAPAGDATPAFSIVSRSGRS